MSVPGAVLAVPQRRGVRREFKKNQARSLTAGLDAFLADVRFRIRAGSSRMPWRSRPLRALRRLRPLECRLLPPSLLPDWKAFLHPVERRRGLARLWLLRRLERQLLQEQAPVQRLACANRIPPE